MEVNVQGTVVVCLKHSVYQDPSGQWWKRFEILDDLLDARMIALPTTCPVCEAKDDRDLSSSQPDED